MGKDLEGKELGVGISQRTDGLYTARFTNKKGKRVQKYFQSLPECREWLVDARFGDAYENVLIIENPTVDAWWKYWINNVKGNNIRYNTRRIYNEAYYGHIKPFIGNMLIKEIKPFHCQNVLNQMAERYANSVIEHSRLVMWMMFDSAVENEIILKNPVTKTVKCKSGRKSKPKRVLTREEQKLFLETIKGTSNYNQYAFLLQTGLRTGEMVGLKWSDIDFEKRTMCVKRTMEYRDGEWRTNDPKSKNGIRDIPLTQEAVSILMNQKEKLES